MGVMQLEHSNRWLLPLPWLRPDIYVANATLCHKPLPVANILETQRLLAVRRRRRQLLVSLAGVQHLPGHRQAAVALLWPILATAAAAAAGLAACAQCCCNYCCC